MNAQFTATTPTLSESVLSFCKSLEPESTPQIITNDPSGDLGRCYVNCRDYIETNGGTIQYGWTIWELPFVYFTAEHHAVVRMEDGTLIDPTPQLGRERTLVFLPSDKEWNGEPILNKYQPAKNFPLLQKVCELQVRNLALFYAGKFGTDEHQRNDSLCTALILKFLTVKAERDREKRLRKKRK